MVRPEPDQPLGESGFGIDRRGEVSAGFLKIDLLGNAGLLLRFVFWLLRIRRGHVGFGGVRLHLRHRIRRLGRIIFRLAMCCACLFLSNALCEARALTFLAKIESGAGGFAGTQEIVVDDLPGRRLIELGSERAARIGRKSRKRSGFRNEAEAMQRRRRLHLGIERHLIASSRRPQFTIQNSADIAAKFLNAT